MILRQAVAVDKLSLVEFHNTRPQAYVTSERWEAKAQEIGARFPHPLPNR